MALAGTLAVGFVNHLPVAMQRSMSLLPIPVDPAVEADARASTEWRLEMWRDLIAEIPSHLLLGKGLSITAAELDTVTALNRQGRATSAEISKLTGDYHSGPLSVIIPFGIWGVVGWIWFCLAALRVVYMNYRYGDPELKTANTLLFAYFLSKVVMFHLVFGGFYFDLALFAGMVGFSLSLNHGICQPAVEPAHQAAPHGALGRPRLMPSFSNLPR
jgi:hypothetical protein